MGLTARLDMSEGTVDVANNRSWVSASFYIYGNGATWTDVNEPGGITINGSSFSNPGKFSKSKSWQKIGVTKSTWVTHNADGSKVCAGSGWIDTTWSSAAGWSNTTASKKITLTKINRKSSVTYINADVRTGDWWTINYSRPVTSGLKVALWWRFWQSDAKGWSGWKKIVGDQTSGQYLWYTIDNQAKLIVDALKAVPRPNAAMQIGVDTWINGSYQGDTYHDTKITIQWNTCSMPSTQIGSSATITCNRSGGPQSSAAVSYAFGSQSGSVTGATTRSSFSWTVPDSFYKEIPNSTSGTGTLYTSTYAGNQLIPAWINGGFRDNSYTTFTVTTNAAVCTPGVSLSVVDTNARTIGVTKNSSVIVKGESNAQFTITGTAKKYASITGYTCSNDGRQVHGNTGTISNPTSGSFTGYVTDSRGYKNNTTITKTFVDYLRPTCSLQATNPTIEANAKCRIKVSGKFYNGKFGSGGINNTMSVRIKVLQGSTEVANQVVAPVTSGNSYGCEIEVDGLDYTQRYTIQASATDALNTANAASVNVKSTPVFDWSDSDFAFNVPVKFNEGNIIQKNGITYAWNGNEEFPMLVLKDYPSFGMRYKEGNPDTLKLSASGNADSNNADFCINGAGEGTITMSGKKIVNSGMFHYITKTITPPCNSASRTGLLSTNLADTWIPANSYYWITAKEWYNYGAPNTIRIQSSTEGCLANNTVVYDGPNTYQISTSATGFTSNGFTMSIKYQTGNSSENGTTGIEVDITYITL